MASNRFLAIVSQAQLAVLYAFLVVFCIFKPALSLPTPKQSMTIEVPDDKSATTHNTSNFFCIVPAPWSSVAVFYLGNYAAHAATLVTYPGESPTLVIRSIIYALFFPTSGVVRGLNAIFRRATFEKTDLQKAARAGALCMVVRTQSWRPEGYVEPDEEEEGCDSGDASSEDNKKPRRRSLRIVTGAWTKELPRLWPYYDTSLEKPLPNRAPVTGWRWLLRTLFSTDRKLHGTCDFSPLRDRKTHYALAFVPRNAVVESCNGCSTTTLASSYSFVKATVALLQALYASATLVKASGPQVSHFGYAAFGLTVSPYAIMSLVNLIGHCLTPSYDSCYLVENDVLREAKAAGADIDGQVGRLVTEDSLTNVEVEVKAAERRRFSQRIRAVTQRFTGDRRAGPDAIEMADRATSAPAPLESASRAIILERRVDTRRINRLSDNLEVAFTCSEFRRREKIPTTKIEASRDEACKPSVLERYRNRGEKPFKQWFFNKRNRAEIGIPWYSYLFFSVVCLLLGSASLLVVGLVSRFKENNSTHAQRVWTLSWMVFGMVLGTLAGFYNAVLEYRTHRGEGLPTWQKFLFLACGLVFAPPAIGGYVVVGQALRQYGNCATLY